LQRLPIDAVKVDASLVRMLGADDSAAVIVQAIAALASTRGMRVIAEGIDSAAQLDVVRDLHCSHGQGRLFAAPADAQALDDLLSGEHIAGAA